MGSYDSFQNKECQYFPCHEGLEEEKFSCLFCYCPLYALGENCGGNFTYTAQGIKDCTNCLVPHRRENYLKVLSKMDGILELAKKKD
jgi:Zn-finger protein